ncbi:O-linked N-acetylglucosamine transferase, SPINDLY family protein [Ectothiorhodospira mobilis]|uniref:O-linked N-acetylglucosamine transferase, SPINDLY family protein n=1 Tax=Ectothiorhodospira mobilis TaxID=195064 RepID=UPI001906213D|nr:hypothetical protein [Ectothiorhodospira mobilis]MBK1693066.1 hypothetical protein [Ectothiorhodospira mobilis]
MKSLERFKKTLTEIQQALEQGQLERAESQCRQGLKRHPRHPLILSSLARVKVTQDQPEEARKCSDRALENGGLKYPSVVHHHLELLEKEKDFEGMLDVARRSLPVSREPIKSKRILARTLVKANRRREALALFEEILREEPEPGALNDCCNCLYDLGQHEAGFLQNKLAATLAPDALWIRSNLILLGHYLPGMTKEDFIALHKDWFDTCARLHGEIRQLERRPLEGRKLRIGFISNGFWSHPAGWLSYGAIAMLAHYFPCEILLYSTHPPKPKDGVAQRFGELPVTHTALHGWSFNAKLQKLLEDELDVLVEMSGHSEHSALPLVAARVAPVQVKWIGGLSDTSAAPNMDYLLTDWIETPAGSEDTYTENLIRLPGGYVSYAPPAYMPEVNPLPARENGYITFGCFNNLHKINPQIIGLWARILEALPDSRLMLKDRRFEDPDVTAWVQQAFQAEGIPAERLILEKASPHPELLKTYNRIDIALDPWPYTGGLTTIEALFMGVPVVTCPGPSFAGRHAASHLTNAGLPEWVAQDFDDYQRIALDWANRLEDLAELRSNLRRQFQKSPLSGHVQFAANLLHAFELMYKEWTEGKPAAPIEFNGPVPIPESVLSRIPENFDLDKKGKTTTEKYQPKQHNLTEEDLLGHMPEKEQQTLESAIKESHVFLEYGAGGSTLLAIKNNVKKLITVESDPSFLDMVEAVLEKYYQSNTDQISYKIDIGPVGEWSWPTTKKKIHSWHEYAQKPWEQILDSGEYPDLILIDGRFRVACFMACYLFAKPGTKILFDDYANRPQYHVCEKFLPVSKLAGRMALFEKNDADINQRAILELSKYNLNPQ